MVSRLEILMSLLANVNACQYLRVSYWVDRMLHAHYYCHLPKSNCDGSIKLAITLAMCCVESNCSLAYSWCSFVSVESEGNTSIE